MTSLTKSVLPLLGILWLSGCATTVTSIPSTSGEALQNTPATDSTDAMTATGLNPVAGDGTGNGESSIDDLLAAGDDAYRRRDLNAAQVQYALAAERDSDHVPALYRLGVIHHEKNSLDVAEQVLQRALALDPEHIPSIATLGIVLLKKERLREADALLQIAARSDSPSWQVLNSLGVVNDMQSRHEMAREYFKRAAVLQPGSAKIANNMGYSYYLSGDLSAAERQFRDAVRLEPGHVHAWSNLALTYSRQKRHADAKSAFAKVVGTHQAANNLGYLSLLQDDKTTARNELNNAIALSPAYYALANQNLEAVDGR